MTLQFVLIVNLTKEKETMEFEDILTGFSILFIVIILGAVIYFNLIK